MKTSILQVREIVRKLLEAKSTFDDPAWNDLEYNTGFMRGHIIELEEWLEQNPDITNVSLYKVGSNNVVFKVVFRGVLAVARFSSDRREMTSMHELENLARKLPARFRKHFPEIFDSVTVETSPTMLGLDHPRKGSAVAGKTFYGNIVERLELLPAEMSKIEFPWETEKDSNLQTHPNSRAREFHEFLAEFEKSGSRWMDLRADNVMIRPSTGDMVIVDPGMFEFV